jgi:signal transduction histidine kinase/CheY-like chemotaxis protein
MEPRQLETTVAARPPMHLRRSELGDVRSAELFSGQSQMGSLIRGFDWATTPLGPIEKWSASLRFTVRFMLANSFPMLLWWGPDFYQIYNDAYIPVLGDKHPNPGLGRPLRECWSEIFKVLEPLVQTPFEGGPPTWMEDILLEINRYGFMEESHFTIGYSPVPDETAPNGIGGVMATVHEITEKIVGQRRIAILRDLGAGALEGRSAEEVCAMAASILSRHTFDIPFAFVYLLEEDGNEAVLAGDFGRGRAHDLAPERIVINRDSTRLWRMAECRSAERMIVIDDLASLTHVLPPSPWGTPAQAAAVVPIKSNTPHQLAGFLVAGISPRLRFDDAYRTFFELTAAQISTAIATARAYEEERKRNKALAEIDRAKTVFFANISHEFRTPLTMMMAPLEDALAPTEALSEQQRTRLEVAHRNSLRLLKLVNTLLDFSRIEAGRLQAVYEPVELASLTAELASVFRSTVERAGLELIVDCPTVSEPVYVDRDMWEKIVLNLVSNAFKFTLDGSITVSLKCSEDKATLEVRDTGTGIQPHDLLKIFDRFYRATNPGGRSYEGSGIGLSLVQELVKLNGGQIEVESEPGKGSIFTVSIPLGSAHIPHELIIAERDQAVDSIATQTFQKEALRWLPQQTDATAAEEPGSLTARRLQDARVVLAEDNADMREYLERLLSSSYRVEAVVDGKAALEAVDRQPPDLVLADVMMPELDGFGLLKAMRASERTAAIPVILLSARAGEESRVEGVNAGADDYLIKPFSARELSARVENHIALSRLRRETECRIRESEERFRALVAASSDVVYRMSPDWKEMRVLSGRDFIVDTKEPSRSWLDTYIYSDDQPRVLVAIENAIRNKSDFQLEHRVKRVDGSVGWTFSRAVPLFDANGNIVEWFGAASDITRRKQSEEALLRSEKLATLGRMAATISHEINNPLEALTNLLFLAQHQDGMSEKAHNLLEMADAELQRVAHITRQSLGFYRESNAPAPTSISRVLESCIELLRSKLDGKHISVQKEIRDDVSITAVAGELRQVFSNLLSNSIDAVGDQGRIHLRVSASHSLQTNGCPSARITLSDNGRGMPTDVRRHLFEPFFTTKGMVGTGLGLWVTRQIVEKHGGSIRVRTSNEGEHHGTAFSVVLPAKTGLQL